MGINFKELQEKMAKAGTNGISKLNMRNEDNQQKHRAKRFNHLKKEKKKKSKILFLKEIAIPFNPETGKEDDTYNAGCKWRPPYSVPSVMKLAKSYAQNSEEAKEVFMRYAGVSEWNVEDPDTLTETDYKVFGRYLTARIFSIPAVHVSIPAMCNNAYGRDYTVDVKIDPITGQYEGEMPIILQAHKFFIEMAYEELTIYNDKIKSGELKHDEKQQKEEKQKIFSKVLISDLQPINFIQCFEIPLNTKFDLEESDAFTGATSAYADERTVLARVNKKIADLLDKFDGGDYEAIDTYPEYYVIDMSCPNDTDIPSELGQRTSYEKELKILKDMPGYPTFRDSANDYLDKIEQLEETVFRSSYISRYDESVDNQILTACSSLIDVKSPYFTKKVIESNKDFLMLALGDKMDEILVEIDVGISDKADGNLNSAEAKKEANTYDISSALGEMSDFDAVETEELVLND